MDLSEKIERIEKMENKFDIELKALYCVYEIPEFSSEPTVQINGEIHSVNGDYIREDLYIVASIYDKMGRMIAMENESIYSEDFYSFEPFHISVETTIDNIDKIKIYPKKM